MRVDFNGIKFYIIDQFLTACCLSKWAKDDLQSFVMFYPRVRQDGQPCRQDDLKVDGQIER
jgi:hypothetical protein